MVNISLISPPGGGKGTQSEKIEEKYGISHISTGDIFRGIIKGTYQGNVDVNEIKKYMNEGRLIPDEIVVKIVMERLSQSDCQKGYLLDGFPRTIKQAEEFDRLSKNGKELGFVILIDVLEDSLIKRLTGRRTCSKCGKIYNVYFNPPKAEGRCDDDNAELSIRTDDNVETVTNRLKVYREETSPLIEYYKNKGILVKVDGNKEVDLVFKQITEVITR